MDKFKVTHTQTKQNAIMRERERESHINEIYCFACIQLTLTEWLERGMHLVRDERAFTKQKKTKEKSLPIIITAIETAIAATPITTATVFHLMFSQCETKNTQRKSLSIS